MFVDYVKQSWLIPHIQRFVKAWTNKVMHLGNTTTNSVWEAMNNMITLQHTEIKISFETSKHVVKHIIAKFERVNYVGIDKSRCGCIMRTTQGLPCACELARYVVDSIPLDTLHMFWPRLSFSYQGLFEPKVCITEEMKVISKWFEDLNDFIENIVDVKADGLGEDSWFLVRNHLLKEIEQLCDEYIDLLGGINRYEQLKWSLLVTMIKWMNIINMGYVIASWYNVILVSLSLQQSMTFFPHRSQPPRDNYVHHIICIGHVYDNHFVQV
ncbi:hypothetical protein GmHk_10G028982 [Glycine max]|nr:hypothetical protein GmHk_10G028982 [Glycine max]